MKKSGRPRVRPRNSRDRTASPPPPPPAPPSRAVPKIAEQLPPPLGEAQLEGLKREAVPRGVALGDRVPTEMFDRNARLFARGLEAHVELRVLVGAEALLTPGDDQAVRRIPDAHFPDDEDRTVFVSLDQA